jgi:zinc transport system substrate-binding protein/iron/zinc/copper transport system substrate-binding protein
VKIRTDNDPAVLKEEAGKLAALFGTEESFKLWCSEFDRLTGDIQSKIYQAYPERRAVVQRMQSPFIKWLGFDIIGEYGPAEPSPALILELARPGPVLVVDNYHGPSGTPIAEAAGGPYAELINFPGKDGTKTLADVFRYNMDVLIKVSGK